MQNFSCKSSDENNKRDFLKINNLYIDANKIDFLPRLRAALEIAKATQYEEDWNVVKRETFFVIDALESAACVLENHLIH